MKSTPPLLLPADEGAVEVHLAGVRAGAGVVVSKQVMTLALRTLLGLRV